MVYVNCIALIRIMSGFTKSMKTSLSWKKNRTWKNCLPPIIFPTIIVPTQKMCSKSNNVTSYQISPTDRFRQNCIYQLTPNLKIAHFCLLLASYSSVWMEVFLFNWRLSRICMFFANKKMRQGQSGAFTELLHSHMYIPGTMQPQIPLR